MGGAHPSSNPKLAMDKDKDPLDSHTLKGLAPM